MEKIEIYHNTRCSTSRHALQILEEKGLKPEVRFYLKTPPTETELRDLLKKLNISAEELVRKREELYKEQLAGQTLSEDEWIKVLSENPILIQRPIVIKGDKAIIARPWSRVYEILES